MKRHPTLHVDIYVDFDRVYSSTEQVVATHDTCEFFETAGSMNSLEDVATAFVLFLEEDNVIDDFHRSNNKGSQSWYITYHSKHSDDYYKINCVFHYRISDHGLEDPSKDNRDEREKAHRDHYLENILPQIEKDTGKKVKYMKFHFVEAKIDNQTYFSYEDVLKDLIRRVKNQKG